MKVLCALHASSLQRLA